MPIDLVAIAHGFFIFVFIIFWLLAFFIFYHLARFGIGLLPRQVAIFFLVGTAVLFSISFSIYTQLDLSFLNNIQI